MWTIATNEPQVVQSAMFSPMHTWTVVVVQMMMTAVVGDVLRCQERVWVVSTHRLLTQFGPLGRGRRWNAGGHSLEGVIILLAVRVQARVG